MGFKTCWVPGYGSLGYGSGSAFSHPCLTHTQTLGLVGFLASLIARNLPPNVSHTPPQDPQMCLQTHTVDTLKWALQMGPSNVPFKCTLSTSSMPSKCAPQMHLSNMRINTINALVCTPQTCAISVVDVLTHAPQMRPSNTHN